ncbi:MAG: hypothetical protein WDW38_002294 [Sanguina aurantia]
MDERLSLHESITLVRRLGVDGQGLLITRLLEALGMMEPQGRPQHHSQEESFPSARAAAAQDASRLNLQSMRQQQQQQQACARLDDGGGGGGEGRREGPQYPQRQRSSSAAADHQHHPRRFSEEQGSPDRRGAQQQQQQQAWRCEPQQNDAPPSHSPYQSSSPRSTPSGMHGARVGASIAAAAAQRQQSVPPTTGLHADHAESTTAAKGRDPRFAPTPGSIGYFFSTEGKAATAAAASNAAASQGRQGSAGAADSHMPAHQMYGTRAERERHVGFSSPDVEGSQQQHIQQSRHQQQRSRGSQVGGVTAAQQLPLETEQQHTQRLFLDVQPRDQCAHDEQSQRRPPSSSEAVCQDFSSSPRVTPTGLGTPVSQLAATFQQPTSRWQTSNQAIGGINNAASFRIRDSRSVLESESFGRQPMVPVPTLKTWMA